MRILYILSANPIGEFSQELVYLRISELRQAGFFLFLTLLVEVAEQFVPFLVREGWLRNVPDLTLMVNAVQALLILVAVGIALLVVRRYTHRALDRRIRESMETLAYLEGQRRRRRQAERGGWERAPLDEE